MYNFVLNPDWLRFFSYASDIHAYQNMAIDTFELRKCMTFNTEVVGSYWQEDARKWKVKRAQLRSVFDENFRQILKQSMQSCCL